MPWTVTIDSPFAKPDPVLKVLETDEDVTVGQLLQQYCDSQGVPVKSDYLLQTRTGIVLDDNKTLATAGILDGDTLVLGIRAEETQTFRFVNWWLVVGIALGVGLFGIITISILYAENPEVPFNYGVVFDAGSSHTEMYVYKWKGDKWKGTGIITSQLADCRCPGKGISSFINNTDGLPAHFAKCLSQANSIVPDDRKAYSPILLGATAGMRLLDLQNPNAALQILIEIQKIFSGTSFLYSDDQDQVTIISGETEGISGWITVNYLYGTFDQKPRYSRSPSLLTRSLGAMDLGGASTQVTFEVLPEYSNESLPNGGGIRTVDMYGKDYNVYSHSYLCYGVDEMTRRYYATLVATASDNGALNSPCDNVGLNYNKTSSYLFDSPCTEGIVPSTKAETYEFVGTGDFDLCSKLVSSQLNSTVCSKEFSKFHECFSPLPLSPDHSVYVAFSTFALAVEDMGLSDRPSLNDFEIQLKRICNMTATDLKEQGIYENTCIANQYVHALLIEGYGFNATTWKEIHFDTQVANHTVDWALGYMVNATNIVPAVSVTVYITETVFAILVVLFILFLVIAAFLAHHAVQVGKSSSSYQRLSYPTSYGTISA